MSKLHIVWFKRDLRLHDNAALNAACSAAAQDGGRVLPLYVVEPGYWALPEHSGRQFAFMMESLGGLDIALIARGTSLHVATGGIVDILSDLHRSHAIASLHAHHETGLRWTIERNKTVHAWCRRAGIPFREQIRHGVMRDLAGHDDWASRWHDLMAQPRLKAPGAIAPHPVPASQWPTRTDIHLPADPCPQRQTGGRKAAKQLLETCNTASNGQTGTTLVSPRSVFEAYSRLSPHLAFGTLSMREVWQSASAASAAHKAIGRRDCAAALTRLTGHLQRQCQRLQTHQQNTRITGQGAPLVDDGLRQNPAATDPNLIAWFEGQTGFPFIDACMRSLRATGWLDFRLRAAVLSFASLHLWMHWQRPAEWLARRFTDFEPGIHNALGRIQNATTRIQNPVNQSVEQDPDGVFIREWLPELANLPTEYLHQPWDAPAHVLIEAGVTLGQTYPQPIVDHIAAARHARETINAMYTGVKYRKPDSVHKAKHNRRRVELSFQGTHPRSRSRLAKSVNSQLALSFLESKNRPQGPG